MNRITALDAVRGAAALAVAISHYLMAQNPGWKLIEDISVISVEVFFVLSGFVLAPQIILCMEKDNARNLKTFFMRRWMRTLPSFVVALLGVSIISASLFSVDFFKYLFFLRNFFSIKNVGDYFVPAWSLAVEEWFYVVFPLFLLATKRFKISILQQTVIFVVVFMVFRLAVGMMSGDALMHSRRVVLFRLDSIGFGFLLYFWSGKLAAYAKWIWPIIFLLSGRILFLVLDAPEDHHSLFMDLSFFYAAAALGVSVILTACSLENVFDGNTILKNGSSFFGKISYSVYLFHVVFITLVNRRLGHEAEWIRFGAYLALLIGFTYVFYHYVEAPLLAARPKYLQ